MHFGTKELRRRIFSHFYIESEEARKNTVLLVGAGRSGTTWLADLINYDYRYRLVFEPFHRRCTNWVGSNEGLDQYKRLTYANTDLDRYIKKVISEKLKGGWIDAHNRTFYPRGRLIKDVTCLPALLWMRNLIPDIPMLVLVRHPCAVAYSRMRLGWPVYLSLALENIEWMDDGFREYEDYIRAIDDPFELQIVQWCVDNLVPLKYMKDSDRMVVYYEHLRERLLVEMNDICKYLDRSFNPSAIESVSRRRSLTDLNHPQSDKNGHEHWRGALTQEQQERAVSILTRFGLEEYYGVSARPLKELGN